ncbi:MAG: hypothetical protein Q8N53_01535, partial [Longimicrobiales bacterium]|nr:hypothetical protein [Longimicrobiales bacterium]
RRDLGRHHALLVGVLRVLGREREAQIAGLAGERVLGTLIAAVDEARSRFGIAAGPAPAQDTTVLLASVMSNAYDDEMWGDLGDAFAAQRDSASAEACWAVALLRDPYDMEWLDHRPDPSLIPDFVLARGLLFDDQIVGEMARMADSEGYSSASRALFDLAWALDPSDGEWQDMNKGRQIRSDFATAIAEARQAQERRTRELAVESYLVSLRSDLTGGWNWGSAGNEYWNGGDTAKARLFLGMAHLLDPMGSWTGGSLEMDAAQATEAVRALGVTDDEAVGRLANTLRTSGEEEVARGLYALALELDPDDPEWRMQIEGEPDTGGALARGVIYAISLLSGALLGWYGAIMGRDRRRKQGLREKPKPTKGEGWKMEFPPIKEKLAAGWSLGDQPADATGT